MLLIVWIHKIFGHVCIVKFTGTQVHNVPHTLYTAPVCHKFRICILCLKDVKCKRYYPFYSLVYK